MLALAFTSDSRRLVSAGQGEKNAVRIWDLGTGKELPALPDRMGEVRAMWLSADDKTLLVVDGEARLRGWRLPSGKRLDRLPKLDSPAGYSVAAAFSPDGKRLALISAADKHDPREGRLWVIDIAKKVWSDVSPSVESHVESIAWGSMRELRSLESRGVNTFFAGNAIMQAADGKHAITGTAVIDVPEGLILSNLSWARVANASACIGHTAQHPPEVPPRRA